MTNEERLTNISRCPSDEKVERMARKAASALFYVNQALLAVVEGEEASEPLISAIRDLTNILGDAAHLWSGEEK